MTQTAEQFWLSLEAERHDLSYLATRQPRQSFEPKEVIFKRPRLTKHDQKLWFDAGRYAAGDRDDVATAANTQVRKIVGQK
jgi:hypothetical protein